MERPGLLRRAVAEGLAAFALVFAGCGAIVTNATHNALSAPWASASCSGS
jgi:glycerol uptake facilitator-like aquaporin